MAWVPHVETLQLVFVGDEWVLENKYSEEKHVVPAGSKLSFGNSGWAKLETPDAKGTCLLYTSPSPRDSTSS
eukprot:4605816-Prorocentrum_lima.AAC.1